MSAVQDESGNEPQPARRSADRHLYTRLGAVVLLVGLGYLVLRIVVPLWQPLVWAMLLGALLAPVNERLARRLGGRPRLASSITLAMTVVLFLLPLTVIAGAVAAQATQLLQDLDGRLPDLRNGYSFNLPSWPWIDAGLAWLQANAGVSMSDLRGWLVEGGRGILQALVSSGGSVVLGALGTLVNLALMLFVLFFLLLDGPRMARDVVSLLPIEEQRRARLWRHLLDVTRAVFLGIGLTALVQGVLVGIGFRIAGLPSPLVFGVVATLSALIPVVGASLVWVPGVLYLVATGDYGHATFLAAWGVIAVGLADNLLRPILISGQASVPTLAVFIGVMGGLAAFGFIGLFVGPIVLGLLVALFRYEREERLGLHPPQS